MKCWIRIKIGTPGVHVSIARESEMSVLLARYKCRHVTRLNVANVVRFLLYI